MRAAKVETCSSCALPFAVDARHRMSQHQRSDWTFDISTEFVPRPCSGSGRLSREQSARNREAGRRARERRTLKLIAPFRVTAAVALDAVLQGDGDRMRADIAVLLRLAQYHLRAMGGKRVKRMVAYVERNKGGRRSGDLYCSYCGELIAQRVAGRQTFERLLVVRRHVVPCALRHLAFDLTVSPEHKLPAEMRREVEA